MITIQVVFDLSFSPLQWPRQVIAEVRCAIFHKHQISGACAGVCTCNCTHQMEKTVNLILLLD